ncbi:MAG TPA: pseudouridine-5'-phosphate glycosidase, partial [Gemmatimonadaceae bacterium]
MTNPAVVPYLEFRDEVYEALSLGLPVVALESTIISHGMPHPQNVDTARQVEAIVRAAGAVPATIAVLHGQMKVGLSEDELEFLGTSKDIQKISIRDLPMTVAMHRHGATTVATTMRIASFAGIRIFATGGTGGAHRGGATTFDVSADLTEL